VVRLGVGSVVSGRAGDLARSVDRDRGKALPGVELWAEIRRLKHVERLSQREIHRRTGVHRDTIRNALASSTPPVYGPRPPRPSKLEPFVAVIEELIAEEPTLSGVRIREGPFFDRPRHQQHSSRRRGRVLVAAERRQMRRRALTTVTSLGLV
jgi:transposase